VTHAARELEKPLYFDKVEELNLDHAPLLHVPTPPPLSPVDFERKMMSAVVVDTRSDLAFGAAHIPAAQYIGLEQLARFAGWFLHRDRAILLVTEGAPDPAVRYLVRLGFENIEGYLAGDMWAWHTSGRSSRATRMATVDQLCRILDAGRDPWILDVRSDGELVAQGEIPGAHHIHVTQLYKRRDQVPKHEPVFIFCGSGTRAMIAASFLQRGGWKDVVVVLGGLAGWNATTCQLP
ncbi:MAG: rhodanese-like domain-containing protein, partial [Anaerolineae bacterium]|nr:rhodanese-like domain-containing protein [Anaerolineae bacterium]